MRSARESYWSHERCRRSAVLSMYTDLRRDCELVEVPGGRVRVASPLDLLRIERACNHVAQAGAIEAVLGAPPTLA